MTQPAILALEDGSIFRGVAAGALGQACGEVVFNTAMTGYQEILSDPSYAQQMVTLTCPHIGNVGSNQSDNESRRVWASGLIVREMAPTSSWRSEAPLFDYLQLHNVVAIAEIDTRRLTRLLRTKGALRGCIQAGEGDDAAAVAAAQALPSLSGMDLAQVVTTQHSYTWSEPTPQLATQATPTPRVTLENPYHVVVYDFGVKRNILQQLVDCGCRVTVVPAKTPVADVLALQPEGVMLSNGPGDPEPCDYAIAATQELLAARIPLFGICLGLQILALASGLSTEKMKFGHHGANHPVQDCATGRVMVTSQNHGFAVADSDMPAEVTVTHRSLFDNSIQGIRRLDCPAFGFQGHPEASPGPHDVAYLFATFTAMIDDYRLANAEHSQAKEGSVSGHVAVARSVI